MAGDLSLSDPKDRRDALTKAVNVLAATIAIADPGNVAALVKQYRETLAELASLPDAQEVNPLDALADELAERRTAKVPNPPAKRGKQRASGS